MSGIRETVIQHASAWSDARVPTHTRLQTFQQCSHLKHTPLQPQPAGCRMDGHHFISFDLKQKHFLQFVLGDTLRASAHCTCLVSEAWHCQSWQ